MSYSVVIPCYHNFEQLQYLLLDIANTNQRYRPEEIIIVNDANNEHIAYAESLLSSTSLPPLNVINLNAHLGPLLALEAGLKEVKTPYAIFLHSDVRLTHPEPITARTFETTRTIQSKGRPKKVLERYSVELIGDPLSLLYYKLLKTEDAFAVGCYALDTDYVNEITSGERALNHRGLPNTFMAGNWFDWLWYQGRFAKDEIGIGNILWKRILSIDTTIVAMNMRDYSQFGFNHQYLPYRYFFDDFCGILRLAGKHLYMTMDTIVYHPKQRLRPKGSKAEPTIEDYEEKMKIFKERWNKNPIWEYDSLYGKTVRIISS